MSLKNVITLFIISVVLLAGFASCKNDVEIFAPQSDVTLVYGLLNADDSLHQIKINRVFQGEKSVEELAKDPTLSEYENLNARVIELNVDGKDTTETGNQWTLNEVTITTKDSGYFYYPNQKVYEFVADLDDTKYYKIVIDKSDESKVVESTTEIIRKNVAILNKPNPPFLILYGLSLAINGELIEELDIEVNMPVNAKIVDIYLDFSWSDEYNDGTFSEEYTISYKIGTQVISLMSTDDKIRIATKKMIPSAFYEFIAGNVPVVPEGSDIKQRIAGRVNAQGAITEQPLQFRFVTGGEEFNTYLEVASPSTSLLETKPEYTNIINGVGIFSCRAYDDLLSKMSKGSIEYLVDGEIMEGRRFCNYANNTDPSSCY